MHPSKQRSNRYPMDFKHWWANAELHFLVDKNKEFQSQSIYKKPDIVILDDALSAVDTTTEQNILSYFDKVLQTKTTLIITHRANNLLNYDKIIVLDEGSIIEQGTHEDLISKMGFMHQFTNNR